MKIQKLLLSTSELRKLRPAAQAHLQGHLPSSKPWEVTAGGWAMWVGVCAEVPAPISLERWLREAALMSQRVGFVPRAQALWPGTPGAGVGSLLIAAHCQGGRR